MRNVEEIKKRRKLRIRRDPEKSPLNLIRNKLEPAAIPIEEEVEQEKLEETPVGFVQRIDQLSKQVQMLIEEEEHDEKQYQLLKLMYMDDVDSKYAVNSLGISENELKSLVEELVELGFLKFISDDEAEITEDGISYLKWRDLEFEP